MTIQPSNEISKRTGTSNLQRRFARNINLLKIKNLNGHLKDYCIFFTVYFSYIIVQDNTSNHIQEFQGGRGHWDLYYTSPQSFIITLYYLLAYQYGDFYLISICQFIKLSVQTFQPLIVIYRRGNLCIINEKVHTFMLMSYPCILVDICWIIFQSSKILTLKSAFHLCQGCIL